MSEVGSVEGSDYEGNDFGSFLTVGDEITAELEVKVKEAASRSMQIRSMLAMTVYRSEQEREPDVLERTDKVNLGIPGVVSYEYSTTKRWDNRSVDAPASNASAVEHDPDARDHDYK